MALVFHIISGLKVGGAEMALLRLASASRGGPYRHMVASLSPEGAMRERFAEAGIGLLVFDFKRAPVRSLAGLYRALRRERPAIVQTWMYHADLIGALVARLAGCRRVIWGIRTTEVKPAGAGATAYFVALCARLSRILPTVIVCVAEASRRAHVGIGYDDRRMRVVPNGFELVPPGGVPGARAAVRAACGLAPDAPVVGFLGRFHPDKDQQGFIAAATIVAQAHPDVRFMMVGRDLVAGNAQLMEWIQGSGCAERFILLGERADVGHCLAAMDLFCQASRTEGFPNAVGEAMALGLPCVVTDAGDAALLVGDTGTVVPVGDPVALAAGLDAMLALGAAGRAARGSAARARVGSEYSMERARARFEAIYQDILKKGSI